MKQVVRILSASIIAIAATLCGCSESCRQEAQPAKPTNSSEAVIATIMSRRSVRNYLPQPVGRDTMEIITFCGIQAPNAMNKQGWEVRVVDSPEFLNGLTKLFVAENPQMAEAPGFRNMFRNAPTVVFIAAPEGDYAGVDCGLLGENMILTAWSMGIGSCCLGGPVRFMKTEAAADYLKRLNFSEGYTLLYAIGFGHPAESPEAKPRDDTKIAFID